MSPLPTGMGREMGQETAGVPGQPLPSRPERARANDAAAIHGHAMVPDNAAAGDVDMAAGVDWSGTATTWPQRDQEGAP